MLGSLMMAALTAAAAVPDRGGVRITVYDVRPGSGDLYVGLQTREQFLRNAATHGAVIKVPTGSRHEVILANVAHGEYSVSVWHDINGNRQFDVDDKGIPLDGWAMVKGDRLRGKPTFEQVKVRVDATGITLALPVVYPRAAGTEQTR